MRSRGRRGLAAALLGVVAACSAPWEDASPPRGRAGDAGGQPQAVTGGTASPAPPGASPGGAPASSSPRTFTLVAAGDVLIHPPVTAQAHRDGHRRGYDFRRILAGVKPVVAGADLAICHLETPLAPSGGPFEGYPTFDAPPQVAEGLAATGYDTCSTASNHTLDQGASGVARTLDALDDSGIRHAGSARSHAEAHQPTIIDVEGALVAHLSYTFSFNGISPSASWIANPIDREAILRDARKVRQAGAQVVVVSLHWGSEYWHEPTPEQRDLAEALLSSSAVDLIVGHHAHVVQPFERVDGSWVAYGLGNHLAHHAEPVGESEEGVIARFTFGETRDGRWKVTKAEAIPTLIDLGPPLRVVALPAALSATRTPLPERQRVRYGQGYQRTRNVLTGLGADDAGLVVPRPATQDGHERSQAPG
ncbi:MAG: CapA family protein [Streptomycetales bacterium]